MRGTEFKERALHEGLRYGEDPLVFLRELAQNARDAGAKKINVVTALENGDFVLTFSDDGNGMEYEHARKFLFTLYASSKEDETTSAGRFGVGFWSVLLFRPSSIEIESASADGKSWRVVLDGDLDQPRFGRSHLATPGTQIRIRRPVGTTREADKLRDKSRQALRRYCRYLRRNETKALPLPILFNEKPVNEPFSLGGPCWMTFRNGKVEGAVGLGDRPKVDLYARGLLVWRGTVLDELKYGATPSKRERHPQGLAPVYVLGGNELNVTLDRRAVVDDGSLGRVRHVARQRMRDLVRRYLDRVSPRPFVRRIADWLSARIEDLRYGNRLTILAVVIATLLVLGGGAFFAADYFDSPPSINGSDPRISDSRRPLNPISRGTNPETSFIPKRVPVGGPTPFLGPVVDPILPTEQVALEYKPKKLVNFRLAAHERLHAGLGMLDVKLVDTEPAPRFSCASGCLDIRVEIATKPGLFLVPVPTGHLVESGSLRLDGRRVSPLRSSQAGEPVIRFKSLTTGILEYRVGPHIKAPSREHRRKMLATPPLMKLPAELERLASSASRAVTVTDRVEKLRHYLEERIIYDRSDAISTGYTKFQKERHIAGWLDFVLTYGRGDCDVNNTVLVVLLRRVGIPARLAVGVVGEEGRANPGLHAWAEYYDNGWHEADATGISEHTDVSVSTASPDSVVTASPDSAVTDSPAAVVDSPPTGRADPPDRAPPDRAPPDQNPPTTSRSWLRTAATFAGVVAVFAMLAALVLVLAGRNAQVLVTAGGAEDERAVAAEILTNALTHPTSWERSGNVAHRKLLPILGGGKDMSLDAALERGLKGRLWRSSGEPDLVKRAVSRGARILDVSDPAFSSLIKRLPGIIDLDETAGLRPTRPEKLASELSHVGALIVWMNRLLVRAGLPKRLIIPCLGLRDATSRDVDLTGLRMSRGSGWSASFVAVNPQSKMLLEKAALGRRDPGLAAFLTLDALVEKSDLLRVHKTRIRRVAARRVFDGKRR
ncbi:MAG: hypothetical protein GY854_31840 [Deltaproteobacteria bacterium]|nr:hypothetical protein [Deltaproteobacteria bacterium]